MAFKLGKFYKLLEELQGKDYIENLISYNVSLVCARVKPSITLTLPKNNLKESYNLWLLFGIEYIKTLGLDYINLRENTSSLVVFIFHKDTLEKVLLKDENKRFLNTLGYNNLSFNNKMVKLQERYKLYNCPHELGIFLGFPTEDVLDFMNCSNKECLACGYWKVYNEEKKAKKVFNLYDKVKEEALECILNGNCFYKTSKALSLKFKQSHQVIFN